jgi:hypothetical protein
MLPGSVHATKLVLQHFFELYEITSSHTTNSVHTFLNTTVSNHCDLLFFQHYLTRIKQEKNFILTVILNGSKRLRTAQHRRGMLRTTLLSASCGRFCHSSKVPQPALVELKVQQDAS